LAADSIQKTEIDSLKLEIEKLKLISDSAQAILDSHPLTEKEKADADAAKKKADAEKDSLAKVLMEKELNNSGTRTETDSTSAYAGALESGFYIIIGTFSSLDNAQNFTKDAKKKGYKTAQIIQNKKSQLHQIVIFKTKNKDEALEKLEGIKTDYFDVWVLTLE
jgi:cell division septation protein DedD